MRNVRRLIIVKALMLGALTVSAATQPALSNDTYKDQRMKMVNEQIARRGVTDSAVLDAMRTVPRHRFVDDKYVHEAYEDYPLPIGEGQTISQPFIVAAMTEALGVGPTDTVLEIGTGSGYQAAVLAEIVDQVYTIEILEPLGKTAESTLTALGYKNIHVKIGDGYRGWPEHAPFDGIIVTAAPDHIPQPLLNQLAMGGRLVIPVGQYAQSLAVLTKTPEGITREDRFGVRFVPMTGEAQNRDEDD